MYPLKVGISKQLYERFLYKVAQLDCFLFLSKTTLIFKQKKYIGHFLVHVFVS